MSLNCFKKWLFVPWTLRLGITTRKQTDTARWTWSSGPKAIWPRGIAGRFHDTLTAWKSASEGNRFGR